MTNNTNMTHEQLKERAEKEYPMPEDGNYPNSMQFRAIAAKEQRAFISGYLARQGEEKEVAGNAIDHMAQTIACSEDGMPMYWLKDWKEAKAAYLATLPPSGDNHHNQKNEI